MAAGAVPARIHSSRTALEVLEPLPLGKANTFPVTLSPDFSCRRSMISPVSAQIPPQKLKGDAVTKTSPWAEPGIMALA